MVQILSGISNGEKKKCQRFVSIYGQSDNDNQSSIFVLYF